MATVKSLRVATVLCPLPVPVEFGPWVMHHREFAVVAATDTDGCVGQAYCYTRDAPIAPLVRRLLAPLYVGKPLDDPAELSQAAMWTNNAALASGAGHRALSLVDIAIWDLYLRGRGRTIHDVHGGAPAPLPATAIIGYPPSTGPDEVGAEVEALYDAGWRRFKAPIGGDWQTTVARLEAARAVGDDIWLGIDAGWIFRSAEEVAQFSERVAHLDLGWLEDVVPPGDAALVAQARRLSSLPIAMGDEQGGSYYPEALLSADAVDVVRLDISTNGGVSTVPGLLERIRAAGADFSCHMFPHVHSQLYPALGVTDVPIEWGVPGTGVDQPSDALEQPRVIDGLMQPITLEAGISPAIDPDWFAAQHLDDPDGVIEELRR